MTETRKAQLQAQAQVVFEAARILKAHHASHELVAAVSEWADRIVSGENTDG